jgi:hypothetical protein
MEIQTITVEEMNINGIVERQVIAVDIDDFTTGELKLEDRRTVYIHPWDRKWNGSEKRDRSVYVQISGGEAYENAIIDRDEFVEGLLAVFPELTRKEQ